MISRLMLFLIAIGAALLLGQGTFMNFVQAFPTFLKTDRTAVRDGAKVTVRFEIMLRDSPTMIYYSGTEQFVHGQHMFPPAIEQQMLGMQSGETRTFSLSAEEGFGPYDETKTQIVPTADLPLDAQEGDVVDDEAGRRATIVKKNPDTTVLDLNHPLAGKPLIVALQIVAVEHSGERDTNPVTGNGPHPNLVFVDPGNLVCFGEGYCDT